MEGEWVKILGPSTASVQSGTDRSVWYAIDVDDRDKQGSCTCKGFEIRKNCRHLSAIKRYFGSAAFFDEEDVPLIPFRLTTSRYQAKELIIAGGYVPVGISVGKPIRYPWAKYFAGELPLYVNEASPAGIRKITDQELFSVAYRKLLDQHGIGKFQQIFSRITAAKSGRPLALLCYEPKGEFCHRLLFAAWWREMTGDEVPEL